MPFILIVKYSIGKAKFQFSTKIYEMQKNITRESYSTANIPQSIGKFFVGNMFFILLFL